MDLIYHRAESGNGKEHVNRDYLKSKQYIKDTIRIFDSQQPSIVLKLQLIEPQSIEFLQVPYAVKDNEMKLICHLDRVLPYKRKNQSFDSKDMPEATRSNTPSLMQGTGLSHI